MKHPIEEEVRDALDARRHAEFTPGFENRVLDRWKRERLQSPSTMSYIESRALRLVPLALAASLVLAVYSARRHDGPSPTGRSLVARALGWQQSMKADSIVSGTTASYEVMYAALYELPQLNSAGGSR